MWARACTAREPHDPNPGRRQARSVIPLSPWRTPTPAPIGRDNRILGLTGHPPPPCGHFDTSLPLRVGIVFTTRVRPHRVPTHDPSRTRAEPRARLADYNRRLRTPGCLMSTPSSSRTRPWYCRDAVVDEYRTTLTEDGDTLPMLRALKILRAIIVNVGIFLLGGYAIFRGGDPTLIATVSLLVLGAYNGLELSDYLALVRAYQEVQAANTEDTE